MSMQDNFFMMLVLDSSDDDSDDKDTTRKGQHRNMMGNVLIPKENLIETQKISYVCIHCIHEVLNKEEKLQSWC